MKHFIFLVVFIYLVMPPGAFAAPNATINLKNGDSAELTVQNFVPKIVNNGRTLTGECENKIVWHLNLPNKLSLALTCGQFYGGIVRMHGLNEDGITSGVVVAHDWGDEGCYATTSAKLNLSKAGETSLVVKTEFGGYHHDSGKSGCKQATEIENFKYDSAKGTFQKVKPALSR